MTPLEHMARRAETDPLFLAYALSAYRAARGWADADAGRAAVARRVAGRAEQGAGEQFQ